MSVWVYVVQTYLNNWVKMSVWVYVVQTYLLWFCLTFVFVSITSVCFISSDPVNFNLNHLPNGKLPRLIVNIDIHCSIEAIRYSLYYL